MVQQATDPNVPPISRHEFLSYILLGGGGLLIAEGVGLGLWYGFPRKNKSLTFGDIFEIKESISLLEKVPFDVPKARCWISMSEEGGITALYKSCPAPFANHQPRNLCQVRWVDANNRFECPCCGLPFSRDGISRDNISRNLDRFPMTIFTTDGKLKSNTEGDPIFLPADTTVEKIHIDTGRIIQGASRI